MTQALTSATRRSCHAFAFDAAQCLAAKDQRLDAVTGQAANFVRATTTTALDENGATIQVAKGLPRYGFTNGSFGVSPSVGDSFWYAYNITQQAGTFYTKTVENVSSAGSTSERFWHFGSAAGARISLYRTSTGLSCVFYNGTATKTATLTIAWSANDTLETLVTLAASGAVVISASVNGAAAVVGSASATQTLPAAWGSAAFYINTDAAGANAGNALYRLIYVDPGVQTLATMQAA